MVLLHCTAELITSLVSDSIPYMMLASRLLQFANSIVPDRAMQHRYYIISLSRHGTQISGIGNASSGSKLYIGFEKNTAAEGKAADNVRLILRSKSTESLAATMDSRDLEHFFSP